MTEPLALATIVIVDIVAAAAIVAMLFVVTAATVPRVEAWCARRNNRLFMLLAPSDAAAFTPDAVERARDLFLAHLDPRQRRSWQHRRRFDVTAASGRRYTIGAYRPFNVSARDATFCVQVHGTVPSYDKLLAQKLLIEADEQLFLARANIRSVSQTWERLAFEARAARPERALA
jgi:hypothetical protein